MRRRVEACCCPRASARRSSPRSTRRACASCASTSAHVGLPPSFVIYDEDDRQALVKDVHARARPRRARAHAGDRGASHQPREEPDADRGRRGAARARAARGAHRRALRALRGAAARPPGAVDFDDLLLLVVRLLETVPEVLDWYRGLWQHVLVDEYQDTNRAQYRIVRLLTAGASQRLRRRRSRPVGLQVARRGPPQHPRLREGLPGRASSGSSRTTARPSASSPIAAARHRQQHRAQGQDAVDGERRGRARPRSTARGTSTRSPTSSPSRPRPAREGVDYRRRRRLLPHERAVARAGGRAAPRAHPLPHRGRRAVLRAQEIKDTSPTCASSSNPADDVAFRRAVAAPARGIGQTTLDRLDERRARAARPLLGGLRRSLPADISGKPRRALEEFARLIARLAERRAAAAAAGLHRPRAARRRATARRSSRSARRRRRRGSRTSRS